MKFKTKTMKARDIGKLFGESSHTINQWLEKAGLLDAKSKLPTWEARNDGFSTEVTIAGFGHQAWVPEKVVPKLIGQGHELVINLPADLVEPVPLTGPFECRGRKILNCDGDHVAFLSSTRNAELTCRLLNAAHKAGTISRFLSGNSTSCTTIIQSS